MSWWARRPLRIKIFLAFSGLLFVVLLATLVSAQVVVSRDAERALSRELVTTGQVFQELMAERAARLATSSMLLASDFALKRVIATRFDLQAYEQATLVSAATSYRRRIGVELLWITDETGTLLATAAGSQTGGRFVARLAPLAEAMRTEDAAAAIAEVDGRFYQLVAVPVFGPDVIAYLLLGQVIDDGLAARLKDDTGSDISFLAGNRVIASTWPQALRPRLVAQGVPRRPRTALPPGERTFLLTLSGERYLSLVVPVGSRTGDPVRALVQGSWDRALAPLRSLQWRIALIGALALAVALLVGVRLAAGITAPVRALVSGMKEVLRGNLRYRARDARADEIGFLARAFNEMVGGLEERERIKDTFGRFVSREVAEAVLGGHVPLEGERREVSILFQDIRGFTALSERLDPAQLLELLNRFFTEAVAAVEAEGGVVKQFTGDGVLALFGAPQPCADHAQRAVRAALGILARLAELNVQLARQGLAPLAIGIGVHSGEVVAGLIGPDRRVEYGAVGEAVNVASRIESATKDLQATLLVSREVAARLGAEFVLGRSALLHLRGRSQPLEVVEILGPGRGALDAGAPAAIAG